MPEEDQTQETAQAEPERARPHHFGFAFKVFYDFVKYDPLKFRNAAQGDQLTEIIRHLWTRVGEGLPAEHRISADQLDCISDKVHGRTRVIVVMPPAQYFCECLFMAVVFKPDTLFLKSKEFTIYTLEQSLPENGKPTTAVCTIGAGGIHANYGVGPDDLAGFKHWLDEFLQNGK